MASLRAVRDDTTDRALRARLQAALGGTFRLGDELDGGGVSRLFRAEQLPVRRPVVVKVLAGTGVDAPAIRRFRQEAAVMAALRHPHILPVLAAGEGEALAYFVTPHAGGGSLRARLRADGRLGVAEATRLLQQVAAALAHAHAAGVVHGDLKPENILLEDGHAVLADFGGARLRLRRGQAAPASGPVCGTPLYMSPEQAAGEVAVDARSDLYSLAVVGYELLTGRPPFTGRTPHEVLLAHLDAPVPSVAVERPEVPAALSRVLARAMAKQPAERFSSAGAFRRALASAVTIVAARPAPSLEGAGRTGSRRPPLSPPLRRAAALLLTVGMAGAATMGVAQLFALQFGRTTIGGAPTAFADLPRSAAVPAVAHTDTMARSIATLPPLVATAPRALAVRERAGDVIALATSGAPTLRSARVTIVHVDAPRRLASLPPQAIADFERHGARLATMTADAVVAHAVQLEVLKELQRLNGPADPDRLTRPAPESPVTISIGTAREMRAAVRELRVEIERTTRDARRLRITAPPARGPATSAEESCPSLQANGTA